MKRKLVLLVLMLSMLIFVGISAYGTPETMRKADDFLKAAQMEMERGNIKRALIFIENCLELNPANREANLLLAKIITKTSKLKKLDIRKESKEVFGAKWEKPKHTEEKLPAVQNVKPGGGRAEILWEDFEGSWGPTGNDPPAGWTIIDNGDESPSVWNNNDWYNYDNLAPQNQVARVYYSPIEQQDEWLITPMLDVPAGTCSLKFWNYFSQYSTTDTGYVLGSIDDGANWTDTIAIFTTDILGSDTAYDITSWASGQSQAKIAFNYKANDDLYWMVDECSVATYVTHQFDVAVTAILQPPDSVPRRRRAWTPRARIHNYGTDRVRNFDVICTFESNNSYLETFTVSSWFYSGDDLNIDFANWNPQNMGIDSMTVWHNVAGDGDRSNDTLINEVKIVQAYFTGGPDAFGYSWVDSDTTEHPNVPTYSWIAENGGTACSFSLVDDYEKVPLPFTFRFYDGTYDSIYICTNGFVSFGAGYTSFSNTSIPSSATPNNAIYVHWDDMDPISAGNVYYKGLTGPDRFAIIWKDVPHYSNIGTASFEIILYDNGGILLQYDDVNFGDAAYNFGRSATVGLENGDGSVGLEYMFDWDPWGNLLLPNRAIDFPCDDVPTAPIIYPLFIDLDGDFDVYWTESIDRDGIAAYQLDEVIPVFDTLLDDPCLNNIFNLNGFSRSNTRGHNATPSYGSRNVSSIIDTMISEDSFPGADTVSFWWWGGCETTYDYGYFDISTNSGASWINLGTFNGNDSDWVYEKYDVSSYRNYDMYLRFRYDSDVSNNYGGFWVDDILVTGLSWNWIQTFSNSIPETTYNVTGASNGWHYYRVRGQDNLSNWGNWSAVEDIWIGPNDAPTITITAPDTSAFVQTPAEYPIKWIDSDTDNNASISLYYDTDNTGYDGILITSGISEDDAADSFVWNLSAIYGTYYVYAMIDDGINAPAYSYSNGTISHFDLPAPPIDGLAVSNEWLYFIVDPNEDLFEEDASNILVCTVKGDTAVTSDDGVKLLYYGSLTPYPWSSGTTIMIDDVEYVMSYTGTGGGNITDAIHYISGSGPTEQQTGGDDGISFTMTFGDIEVRADALLATGLASFGHFDQCLLRYTVVNTSNNTDHTVGVRIHFDTMLDTQDGALIRVQGWPYTTKERMYSDLGGGQPIPQYYWAKDSTAGHQAATTVSLGILRDYGQAVKPDSFCVAQWTKVDDSLWTYPYDPDNDITDSDIILWYTPQLLAGGNRGDTMIVATYYGSGPFNEILMICLSEFSASYIVKENKIQIFWRTESEDDNMGFNLYRKIEEGAYEKLNDELIPGAGNSSTPQDYVFFDSDVSKLGVYYYKLEQIDKNGVTQIYGPTTIDIRNCFPRISSLQPIYPNPFSSGKATVSFVIGLNDAGKSVSLRIFDVSGRLIKTLINGKLDPGFYSEHWNATNINDRKVSSGVYYMVLETGSARKVQKVVRVK